MSKVFWFASFLVIYVSLANAYFQPNRETDSSLWQYS